MVRFLHGIGFHHSAVLSVKLWYTFAALVAPATYTVTAPAEVVPAQHNLICRGLAACYTLVWVAQPPQAVTWPVLGHACQLALRSCKLDKALSSRVQLGATALQC